MDDITITITQLVNRIESICSKDMCIWLTLRSHQIAQMGHRYSVEEYIAECRQFLPRICLAFRSLEVIRLT